jgi:hypothetical protein
MKKPSESTRFKASIQPLIWIFFWFSSRGISSRATLAA